MDTYSNKTLMHYDKIILIIYFEEEFLNTSV